MMEMDHMEGPAEHGIQDHGCDHGHEGAEGAADEVHEEKLTPELISIKAEENKHMSWKRWLYYFVNFCFLFGASEIVKDSSIP